MLTPWPWRFSIQTWETMSFCCQMLPMLWPVIRAALLIHRKQSILIALPDAIVQCGQQVAVVCCDFVQAVHLSGCGSGLDYRVKQREAQVQGFPTGKRCCINVSVIRLAMQFSRYSARLACRRPRAQLIAAHKHGMVVNLQSSAWEEESGRDLKSTLATQWRCSKPGMLTLNLSLSFSLPLFLCGAVYHPLCLIISFSIVCVLASAWFMVPWKSMLLLSDFGWVHSCLGAPITEMYNFSLLPTLFTQKSKACLHWYCVFSPSYRTQAVLLGMETSLIW